MENKYFSNKNIERNKKPLQNIVYKLEQVSVEKYLRINDITNYLFKDGFLYILSYALEKDYNKNSNSMNWYGLVKSDVIKNILTEKQWSKFWQGQRVFIVQRRIDKKNIKKK